MDERRVRPWPDDRLIDALRRLEGDLAWPVAAPPDAARDLAAAVRERIETAPSSPIRSGVPDMGRPFSWTGWLPRPARRAVLIAIALLIALAAIAGAAGVGLPGLRVLFGGGPVTPPASQEPSRTPSSARPGAALQLGDPVPPSDPAALDARAGFHVRWPADPLAGQPDAAYVDGTRHGQVSLVWAARDGLPATLEPGVGLLLTEFLGSVDDAYYGKVVGSGTSVEPVVVDGRRGYWLSGEPHFFFYTGPGGVVQEDRRWVGDALIWSDGTVTYRLESSLGRDASIEIAQSLR